MTYKNITVRLAALPLVVAAITALSPGVAAAAPDPTATPPTQSGAQLGQHLADLITGWTKPLLIAVAGMMSFAAFGKRNSGQLVTIILVTIVVGGFVYAPTTVQSIVNGIWNSVS